MWLDYSFMDIINITKSIPIIASLTFPDRNIGPTRFYTFEIL
jgi:hypothetical protein